MEHYKPGGPEHEGLQAVPGDEHPEVVPQQQTFWNNGNAAYSQYTSEKPIPPEGKAMTIFGLRRVTFILSVLLALAVVGVAVVGGVLGSRKTTTERFVESFKDEKTAS
jgi:hypothetical protein